MKNLKIEENIKEIVKNFSKESFIYDFLTAFGFTKMTVKRLKEGNSNLALKENQLIIKQKLFYEYIDSDDIYNIIDNLKNDPKTYTHKPRFIIVNNSEKFLAIDTKTNETLDVELKELCKNTDFFLPWTGKEKYTAHRENPADVKAAEKMAKLYDEIVKINPDLQNNHSLNVFLARLLFCFFAEDTGIFKDNLFTKTIANHTDDDGSDLKGFLAVLFESLDKKDNGKTDYPTYIQEFPYVNGKLFTQHLVIPKLNSKIRKLIIECGDQDWKEINPDIFGSMFQAVATVETRSGLGQHYTSVPNIMKVIEPLFLNDLREEFEKADTEKKLRKLLDRLYNLKIFDPACGSGNFLIIAYKQLRLLEMDIIKKIEVITGQKALIYSQLQLHQFYGIEIDDFACEIATLSLWLAEHQMNRKFKDLFGDCRSALPLSKSGNIVCGNATRLNWEEVCPKGTKCITKKQIEQMKLVDLDKTKQLEIRGAESEVYILGNPPYAGAKIQSDAQREDLMYLSQYTNTKSLNIDYVSCWFIKASMYIGSTNAKYAFVSTNSICQGEQISLVWNNVLTHNNEIFFGYQSFKWSNNATRNAGVTCVIIGIQNIQSSCKKYLYTKDGRIECTNITPYLRNEKNTISIKPIKIPISKFPEMILGSTALDGDNLKLSEKDKEDFIAHNPDSSKFIKSFLCGGDYINGKKRYCLWVNEDNLKEALNIYDIKQRIEGCRVWRSTKGRDAQKSVNTPYKFKYVKYKPDDDAEIQ